MELHGHRGYEQTFRDFWKPHYSYSKLTAPRNFVQDLPHQPNLRKVYFGPLTFEALFEASFARKNLAMALNVLQVTPDLVT